MGLGPHPANVGTTPLFDHDVHELAAILVAGSRRKEATCLRTARKALRLGARSPDCWTSKGLTDAAIGRWAHDSLLKLDPAVTLTIREQAQSTDGTVRLLLATHDGGLIESVLIPAAKNRELARTTLCISSQVGCARACTFCETGTHGLTRQLRTSEIVDQFRLAWDLCVQADRPQDRRGEVAAPTSTLGATGRLVATSRRPVSNIVFMGMGEPFDNLAAVTRATRLLSAQETFAFSNNRMTVSTVGVADKFEEFFAGSAAELAVSLNASNDLVRSRIMPINDRFDLAELRRQLLKHLPAGKRVLFQYALFAGVNDSTEDAERLLAYTEGIPCRINVIPANPGPDPTLVAPPDCDVDAFLKLLRDGGRVALVRRPRGRDVGGACGQLAGIRRKP